MGKEGLYAELVNERKTCQLCQIPYGLQNQSVINDGEFDQDVVIGAWSHWQDSLNAKIMVIGQDWGDVNCYKKYQGKFGDELDPTDRNLVELFQSIGIDIFHPGKGNKNPVLFFTNAILCLKEGGLAAKIPSKCYSMCAERYLKRLIHIIEPQIVITLGKQAYTSVSRLYGQKPLPYTGLVNSIKNNPVPLQFIAYDNLPTIMLLPVPHCGQYSSNTFMGLNEQKKVWSAIKGLV